MNKKPEKNKEEVKDEKVVKPKLKKKAKVKRNITSGIAFVQSTFNVSIS